MTTDLISEEELLEVLRWSTQRLTRAVEGRRIFFVLISGRRLFPAFYADPSNDQKHLQVVTKRLGELPGGSKLQFFNTPKGSLGGITPLQALRLGRVAAVNVAADGFACR